MPTLLHFLLCRFLIRRELSKDKEPKPPKKPAKPKRRKPWP